MDQDTTGAKKRVRNRTAEKKRRKLVVQVGQRIGRGVVTDPLIPRAESKSGNRSARLICDCGKEYVSQIRLLVGSNNRIRLSCGCLGNENRGAALRNSPNNIIDLTGHKFSKLTVLERVASKGRGARWRCRCDCGNETIVTTCQLRRNATRSCGCLVRTPRLPPGAVARNTLCKQYQREAARRGLCWELSDDDFARLTSRDCFYCGGPPATLARYSTRPYIYNGIDRVDNDRGYALGNVVSCCIICNRAKMDLPLDAFMAWVGRLTAHQMFSPDSLPSRLLKPAA